MQMEHNEFVVCVTSA